MNKEDFAVNVSVPDNDNITDYVETDPCTVLGNLRGELKPGRTYVMTWAGGEPVEEDLVEKLVIRWSLHDDYLGQVYKASEKRRRMEQKRNPQPAEKPEE